MTGVVTTAEADLQLLQSNLAKSKRISGRASALLGGFDDRLARLERSVARIHAETTGFKRSTANAEALMQAVELLLSSNDVIEREEAVVHKGPRMNNLEGYKASIAKLADSCSELHKSGPSNSTGFANAQPKTKKDQDETLRRVQSAVDSGQKQLGQIALNTLRDNNFPASSIPPVAVERMSNLISFICSLPQSSTGATAYEKELQRLYAETRGAAISNCMEGIATEAIDASKSGGLGGGATLGTLAQELLHLSADEFNLISTLGFPSYSAAYIYRLYLASSSNPLQIFIDAGVQINGIIKKNLLKNARVAFQAFAQLDVLQSEFDEWIRQKGGRAENELSEICQALRASCVRSIPEVYEDVKAWGSKAPSASESTSGQIADMTQSAFAYMQQLANVPAVAENFLQVVGDGKWDFSSAASVKGTPRMDVSVKGLLEKYLGDLLGVLLGALEARSKSMRSLPSSNMNGPAAPPSHRPSVGPIFLLNNISFLRRETLSSSIVDLLGDQIEDSLNRLHRNAKTAYLEIFSGLVSCLMDAGTETGILKSGLGAVGVGPSGEKREVKDRFVRFNEALGDVENVHRVARIDHSEEELRDRLSDEVYRMVIPTYKSFAAKHVGTTHHQLDVATVEARLGKLFE